MGRATSLPIKNHKEEFKMEKTSYILNGVGYTALLAAVIEQARKDSKKDADALKGIEEWKEVVESDINFKIYE